MKLQNNGISTTCLKWIALICMVFDHVAEFIPYMPIWFRWIGRISAPIFVFCMVEGIKYTKNRKKISHSVIYSQCDYGSDSDLYRGK